MQMKFGFAALAAIMLLGASAAEAATSFDQTLAAPGWFDGSGNPNGGFTVTTNNGITIAQRVKLRQDPNVIHSANNVYDVPTGPQPTAPTRAAWNYEFGIICDAGVCPGGMVGLLGGSTMTVTDLTTGHSNTISMLSWLDYSTWNGTVKTNLSDPLSYIAENSQNPIFSEFALAAFYDENAPDVYKFDINVAGLDSNTVFANASGRLFSPSAVPEPATWAMFLLGFGAIGFTLRNSRKAVAVKA